MCPEEGSNRQRARDTQNERKEKKKERVKEKRNEKKKNQFSPLKASRIYVCISLSLFTVYIHIHLIALADTLDLFKGQIRKRN